MKMFKYFLSLLIFIIILSVNVYALDCPGTCQDSPWIDGDSPIEFMMPKDTNTNCLVQFFYKYRKCIQNNNIIRELEITHFNILSNGPACNYDSIMPINGSAQAILTLARNIFNDQNVNPLIVSLKGQNCWSYDTTILQPPYISSAQYNPCLSSMCCSITYTVMYAPNGNATLVNQIPNTWSDPLCEGVGPNGGTCRGHCADYNIPYGTNMNYIFDVVPVTNDNCLDTCYWKTNGNIIKNWNYLGTIDYLPLIFKTASFIEQYGYKSERMRITPEGKVGISLINPHGRLEIGLRSDNYNSNLDFTATTSVISFNTAKTSFNPTLRFYRPMNNNGTLKYYPWWLEEDGYGSLIFKSAELTFMGSENPTSKVTFLNDGKVLIGSKSLKSTNTHSNALLQVYGEISSKSLIIFPDLEWGDFVFKKEYQLMPLDELEKAIKKDKHLPGIPTSDEVYNNGIAIESMQNKLLQKIEELTLYMIDLKKENNILKKKVRNLEKRK